MMRPEQQTRAPFCRRTTPALYELRPPRPHCARLLSGGEAVSINGMHPMGELNFVLPKLQLHAEILMGTQTHTPAFVLRDC